MRPGAGLLSGGIAMLWLSVIVLLPLTFVVIKASDAGLSGIWDAISEREAVSALLLTVIASLAVAAVNAVVGTLTAWVLIRDEFPGKRIVNALIDLPFAMPTIVAGLTMLVLYGPDKAVGINVAFTRWGVLLALLFVTLPFVVRSVQPVLIELDREMEEAASSLGAGAGKDVPPHRAAEPRAGDRLRRRARVRARGRRVRLAGVDLRQHPVQDRGLVGA